MITALDHLVMTVRDIQATISFYEQILGMRAEQFVPATGGAARTALFSGRRKSICMRRRHRFAPMPASLVPALRIYAFCLTGLWRTGRPILLVIMCQ